MSEQHDDLYVLIALLKEATAGNPPYHGYSEDEEALMDQIRAYGDAAIEPLLTFLAQLMAETDATIAAVEDEDEPTYYYADVHITDILGDLALTEEHVRRLLALQAEYPDDDWYHDQLMKSLGRCGEAAVEPSLDILRNRRLNEFHRNLAAGALEEIAKAFPDQRARIADGLVAIMSSVKRREETEDDWGTNGFMLSALAETRQEQYLPFAEKMFKDRRVDRMVIDLDWVRDVLQGRDPMERIGDDLAAPLFLSPEFLNDFAQSLGMKDADELLDMLADDNFPNLSDLPELPDIIDADETHPSAPPVPPAWILPEPPEPFHAKKLPSRNEPCWCGSGKKYKHCHWREDQQKRGSRE